jgi:cytochrome c553
MNEEPRILTSDETTSEESFGSAWNLAIVCTLSGLVVVAFGIGFLILPASQQHRQQTSLSQNIAHALGHHIHGHETLAPPTPETIPTYVVWDEPSIRQALNGDRQRGEFVALNCTACHGEQGVSPQNWVPVLAGIDRIVIYKELDDFRSQTRLSGPMSAIAKALTPQQSADVAAYFSSLPGGIVADAIHAPESGRSLRGKDPTLRLIYAGDPSRGLAGCATCHGPGAYRMGVPSLTGQNALYIDDQLHDFAQGVRRNDMNMPMRTVAAMLTPDEMHTLAVDFSMGPSKVK